MREGGADLVERVGRRYGDLDGVVDGEAGELGEDVGLGAFGAGVGAGAVGGSCVVVDGVDPVGRYAEAEGEVDVAAVEVDDRVGMGASG